MGASGNRRDMSDRRMRKAASKALPSNLCFDDDRFVSLKEGSFISLAGEALAALSLLADGGHSVGASVLGNVRKASHKHRRDGFVNDNMELQVRLIALVAILADFTRVKKNKIKTF